MNKLKNLKVKLIGATARVDSCDWRIPLSKKIERLGGEVLPSYIKPYIYTPRERPETHETIKQMRDTGYPQVVRNIRQISPADHDWLATHVREARKYDLNNIENCDIVIGYIDPDVFTVGAIEELSYACYLKKPIFIAVPGGISNSHLWLTGMFRHDCIFPGVKELDRVVDNINSGKLISDPDEYWNIRDYDADYYDAIYKATNQQS